MKVKLQIICAALIILAGVCPEASAQNLRKDVPVSNKSLSPTVYDGRYQLLNINNITTWVRRDGQSNHAPTGDNGSYFPRSTAWVIYQDGIQWGAVPYLDSNRTLRPPTRRILVGGVQYNIGTQAGRVIGVGASALPSNPQDPAVRVYRIRRDYARMTTYELRRDAAESFEILVADVTESHREQIRQSYERDWREWPVQFGAPYIERNGIPGYQAPPPFSATFGVHDLISGNHDEPGFSGTDARLPADQVLWMVCNDLNPSLTFGLYGCEPMGLEIQILIWGYKRTDGLGNAYFKRIRLINKGGVDIGAGQRGSYWLDSMFVSQWSDIDVGSFGDDLVGCDTTLNLGFGYNGNPTDLEFRKFNLPPPSIGYVLLQGPIVPGTATDTAIFNFNRKPFARNLPMTSFAWYIPGSSISDPPFSYEGALRTWRVFNGYMPDPPTAPWRLYLHPPGIPQGKFSLSGDPVRQTGFLDGLGVAYSFAPGDRRMNVNSGPFRLAPGDTQEVFLATVAGIGADRLSSVGVMKYNARLTRDASQRLFAIAKPPAEPIVKVSELDGEIVLEWGSNLERVEETESSTAVPGYEFEGYNVYQLPSDSASLSEGVKLAVFDRVNGIRYIYDEIADPQSGLPIQTLVQRGFDTGAQRHIRITKDSLRGGALRNGTKYHFAVTAYNYSPRPNAIPKSLESKPEILTVKPRIPFGPQLNTRFGDTLLVSRLTGRTDAKVVPIVIDPLAGTGHSYEVRFDTSGGRTTWYLRNADNNSIVIAGQPTRAEGIAPPIVHGGILLGVDIPLPGLKRKNEWESMDSSAWGWRIVSGSRRFIWNLADSFRFEGFRGDAGWDSPRRRFGDGRMIVSQHTLKTVELRLAETDAAGNFNRTDANASYAYRYGLRFNEPPARPEFAPWIVNPSPGYSFQDYRLSMPLAVYDMDATPPRRLAIAFTENNGALGALNGRYWPPFTENISVGGAREWLFILDADYSDANPNPAYQTDLLTGEIPVMYWMTWARWGSVPFSQSDVMRLFPSRPPTPQDVITYRVPLPEKNAATQKQSAQRVGVFPNPYYAGQTEGAVTQGRFVTFNNLPTKATIRIFNLAGQAVRTLRKESESQFLEWDLTNEHSYLVGSGIYICHVDMPGIGATKILKLGVIQEDIVPRVK